MKELIVPLVRRQRPTVTADVELCRAARRTDDEINIGKNNSGAIRPKREGRTMRKISWIVISILAASFSSSTYAQKINWQIFYEPFVTTAHAQEVDWQKVDEDPWQKGRGERRCA